MPNSQSVIINPNEISTTEEVIINPSSDSRNSHTTGTNTLQIFKEEIKSSESKTWHFKPDPLDKNLANGKHGYTINGFMLTIVRATLTTGGYKCYYTITCTATTYGWYRAYNNDAFVEFLNEKGGVLNHFSIDLLPMACGLNGIPANRFFSSDFNPDIYDIITGGRLTIPGTTWFQCKYY